MDSQEDAEGCAPISIPLTSELNFGVRWDFVGDEPIDLDVSGVSFDDKGNLVEVVYFNKLSTKGDWMVHTGDNTTGEGDDDDEAIQVGLSKVPREVHSIVLLITCHNPGYNLGSVGSVVCQVTNMTSESTEPFCEIPVYLSKDHSAAIVCNLRKGCRKKAGAALAATSSSHLQKSTGSPSAKPKNPLLARDNDSATDTPKLQGSETDRSLSLSTHSDQPGSSTPQQRPWTAPQGQATGTLDRPPPTPLSTSLSERQAAGALEGLGRLSQSEKVGSESRGLSESVSHADTGTEAKMSTASLSDIGRPSLTESAVSSKHRLRRLEGQPWELLEINVPANGNSVGDRDLLVAVQKQLGIPEDQLPELQVGMYIDTEKRNAVQIRPDVNHIVFGVGWTKGDDDLDCTLVYLDSNRQYIDHVNSKNKLVSSDGACVHRGDSIMTSKTSGAADKENVDVMILDIDPNCDMVFCAVSTVERDGAWSGRLQQVAGSYCRLFEVKKRVIGRAKTHNVEDRKELVRFQFQKAGRDAIGLIFACMYRDPSEPSGWYIQPVNEPLNQLPTGAMSPSEFMPTTRALSQFMRTGFRTNGDWVAGGWEAFQRECAVKHVLRLTVGEAVGLGPQGPEFNPHVEVWTMWSGRGRQKYRTAKVENSDREFTCFNETFEFIVTYLDSIRLVLFDRYFVGTITIPLVEHWGKIEELADSWYTLQGDFIEGEVHLQISLSPLPDRYAHSNMSARATPHPVRLKTLLRFVALREPTAGLLTEEPPTSGIIILASLLDIPL